MAAPSYPFQISQVGETEFPISARGMIRAAYGFSTFTGDFVVDSYGYGHTESEAKAKAKANSQVDSPGNEESLMLHGA